MDQESKYTTDDIQNWKTKQTVPVLDLTVEILADVIYSKRTWQPILLLTRNETKYCASKASSELGRFMQRSKITGDEALETTEWD